MNRKIYASAVALLFLLTAVSPALGQLNMDIQHGVEGAAWRPIIPFKSTFFVGYDPEGITDDYAYIAAVPAAVFYDPEEDTVQAAPLLFYEPPRGVSGRELTLNSTQGIEYFMEDWMTYSESLDGMQLINMPPEYADAVRAYNEIGRASCRERV